MFADTLCSPIKLPPHPVLIACHFSLAACWSIDAGPGHDGQEVRGCARGDGGGEAPQRGFQRQPGAARVGEVFHTPHVLNSLEVGSCCLGSKKLRLGSVLSGFAADVRRMVDSEYWYIHVLFPTEDEFALGWCFVVLLCAS